MKKIGITAKITSFVVSTMLLSIGALVTISYNQNYNQLDQAAGEELIGCANITSSLLPITKSNK